MLLIVSPFRLPLWIVDLALCSLRYFFGSAADIEVATRLVRFVPKADFDYREILLRLDLPPSAAAESDAEC